MKVTKILFTLILFVATISCGDETTVINQCEANEDCADGCVGYDNSICSINGICFCSDAIPTTRCDRDEDCAEDCSTYDTHSCSGGICYCQDEAGVQCAEDEDCAEGCADADSFSCRSGTCYCESELGCTDDTDCAVDCVGYDAFTCSSGICYCIDETLGGSLVVSLNPDTPPSNTLPKGATHVHLASFDFTAPANSDIGLSNFIVTRGGIGQANDLGQLYLYNGSIPLTVGATINDDTNTANLVIGIGGGGLTIVRGNTVTLYLVSSVSATAGTSNQHYFYIASAADVVSDAQAVTGDFPVASNTFTIGNVSVNTATISAGTTPAQPMVGQQDAEVGSFRLICSTNDCAVHEVFLTQGGSLSSSKMQNLRLLRGTDEVATASGFYGNKVLFVLDTPYVFPAGQTKSFYVRCDINDGGVGDTIQLFLSEEIDLLAVDQMYGFGASVVNQLTAWDVEVLALRPE